MLLVASPGGSTMRRRAIAAASRLCSRTSRCAVAARLASVTMIASGRAQHLGELLPGSRQQTAADHDVVAAGAELDPEPLVRAHRRCSVDVAGERVEHPLDHRIQRPLAAVDHDVRLGIDRSCRCSSSFASVARGIALRQERPVAAPAGSPEQRVEVGAQPDRAAPARAPGRRVSGSMNAPPPSARTCFWPLEQARDHLTLLLAKRRLPDLGEDVGDGRAGGRLDRRIGVLERPSQGPRQTLADGGLAGAHHADQHDRAIERADVGAGSIRGCHRPVTFRRLCRPVA